MKRILAIVVMVTTALSLPALGQATRGKTPRQPGTLYAPLVDHHQHLFSPAKAKTVYDPPLPAAAPPVVCAWAEASETAASSSTVLRLDLHMVNSQRKYRRACWGSALRRRVE